MLPLSDILEKINPLDKDHSSSGEFCLALLINEKKVQSAILNLSRPEGESLVFGSCESWGNDSAEELIVAADASIANAVTNLPHLAGKQPTKVILGLPEHWVEGNNVNPKKTAILQAVCRKLLLKSLGFVVTPEAIAHFLKKEEGGLPSIILVNLGEAEIVVSLIVQGKFMGSKVVGRSDNLALDLEEGLLRFDYQGVLPSRIFLLKDVELEDIEELSQTLVAYPWVGPENGKKLDFLQLPKVEIADDNFEIKAVVIAGRHELGLEIKNEAALAEETAEKEEAAAATEELSAGQEADLAVEKPAEEKEEELVEDFGFVQSKDILLDRPLVEQEEELVTPQIGEEVAAGVKVEEAKIEEPAPKASFLTRWQGKISPKLKGLRFPLSFPQPNFHFAFQKTFLLLFAGGIFLVGGVFFSFWHWARAEVRVFVQPQKVEKEFDFTVSDKAGEVDTGKMVVPAREMTAEVAGEKNGSVNGKKTVGDKAKGEVEIFNIGEKVVVLAKGVALKGPGGLRFTLDQEVKVASKSMDMAATDPFKPGKSKVAATAAEIGAQYNVTANSQFSLVSGASEDIGIRNPNPFAGGTSREIQAVSREDREGLQKALLAELEGKAKEEFKSKLSGSDSLLSDSLQLKSKTDRFNHEVGDEAGSLSLEEKAVFSISFVKEEDFKVLADQVIAQLIPAGYQKQALKEEKSSSVRDRVKGIYTARVKEEFLPEIDIGKIPGQLKAKTFAKGEAFLQNLPQLTGLRIDLKPKIFSHLKIFPLKEQNITVTIEAL